MKQLVKKFLHAAACAALLAPVAASADYELVSGLQGASGSALGPDGALYVTERLAGRVSRVDPWTGDIEPFVETGTLPVPFIDIGVGGATDLAFIDGIAYVLVTVVGPALDFIAPGIGGTDAVGIYRVTGPTSVELVADIGAWSKANPPTISFPFLLDHGVQYAIDAFRGGLLVTDGHHNRVLWVSLDGAIEEFKAFGDTVPTGLEVQGNTVFLAEAGPVPHLPADGKVVAIDAASAEVADVAAGAPLTVDVEFGLGRSLYALGQGEWNGTIPGEPADADTGQLLRVNGDGTMTLLVDGLDRPTSMEFIGNTAYIVTLGGTIEVIENVGEPPFGKRR